MVAIGNVTCVRDDTSVHIIRNDKVVARLTGGTDRCAGAFEAVGDSLAAETAGSSGGEIVKFVTFRADDRAAGGDGAGGAVGAGI